MRLLVLAVSSILLAGCSGGGGSDDPPTSAPSAPSTSASGKSSAPKPSATEPQCATIWRVGQVLPKEYTTCVSGGQPAEQEVTDCQDGSVLVVYRDEFYATTGTKIVRPDVAPLQDTEEFAAAYSSCTGE